MFANCVLVAIFVIVAVFLAYLMRVIRRYERLMSDDIKQKLEEDRVKRFEQRESERATSLGRDRFPIELPERPPAPAPIPKPGCRSGKCRVRVPTTSSGAVSSDPLTSLLVAHTLFESMAEPPKHTEQQPPQIDPPSDLNTSQFEAAAKSYECQAPETSAPDISFSEPSSDSSFSTGAEF